MALVLADRVKDTTTTTGTGTITLSGTPAAGYQAFSVIGNGNTTYYTIAGGTEWEVGIGTYSSTGPTLSRDTVLASSAGGTTKVTFSAGTKDVFVTYPAEKSVNLDTSNNVSALGTITSGTWQGTTIGVGYGGTGTATQFTAGSVVFAGASGVYSQDNANFFWDDGNNRLGIGTTAPLGRLDVAADIPSLYIRNTRDGTWTPGETVGEVNFYTNDVSVIGAHTISSIKSVHDGSSTTTPAGALAFYTGAAGAAAAERMRLDSAGNLLVGTTTSVSGRRLVIAGGSARIDNDQQIEWGGSTVGIYGNASTDLLTFFTTTTARMRIDANGQVGVGTTPSAWSASYKAIELPSGALWSVSPTSLYLTSNAYNNGTNYIYDSSNAASQYFQALGVHYWQTAASGTAGNTFTFSTRMTLDNGGNLGLGVTPKAWSGLGGGGAFEFYGGALVSTPGGGLNTSTLVTNAYYNGTNWIYNATANAGRYDMFGATHRWYTAPSGTAGGTVTFTQAMTLSSNGGLSVGTTTDPGAGKILAAKGILPRVNAQTTTASPWAWNSDDYDQQSFSALANALTINADAGTPTDGEKQVLRFKDNGTTRTLTFTGGSSKAFRDMTGQLTVSGSNWTYATVANKTTYFGCIYNNADSRWDIIAVTQEP